MVGLFVTGVTGYLSAVAWVDHTLEVRRAIDEWLRDVRRIEASGQQYLDSEARDLEPFTQAAAHERRTAARVRALVSDNPLESAAADQTARAAETLTTHYRSLLSGLDSAHRPPVEALLVERTRLADAFEEACRRMQDEEARLLDERRGRVKARVLVAMAGGSALGAIAFGLLLTAWITRTRREGALSARASDANARLRTLSEIAVALSEVRTKSEVAHVVVDVVMQAVGADICTLYLLDAPGTTLELIGERGVSPLLVEKIRKLSATAGNPVAFETLKTGRPLWAENEAEYRRLFPGIHSAPVEGPRAKAFWSVPLIVERRPVGLLGMGFFQPRLFSADDRVLIDTLSKHCGQALARAVRLEGEDDARRWFTTTLRSIGDAVIATDPGGLVTFMNPVAEGLTGYTEDEARGKPLEQAFHIFSEDTRLSVESPVAKVLREGRVVGLANHTILRARNGDEIPIDDSGAPIRSERDELLGVVLVFRDVSRDKADRARRDFLAQAGETLVASLDYQSTLATVTRLAVPAIADWCAIDILEPGARAPYQAAVAHADQRKLEFARDLGQRYPSDPDAKSGAPEVIRSGKSELYVEIPSAMLEKAAQSAEHLALIRELGLRSAMVVPLKAREHTLGAMTFVYAESRRRYGEEDLAFAEDFARRAAMAIENALALREIDRARAEERKLRADAEIASRAKDEFLAMVSHELRTPLNSILGWAVLLRTAGNQDKVERGLAVIERNARAQAKLIEDVLDVSRIISGKLALSLGPTMVADAVVASIETVAPAADAKGITIDANIPSEPITITADAQRVQQIVWNLLSNAVKFTPKGGRVRVDVSLDGSDVRLEVSDTGEGIRPEVLAYVFEPFQQADVSTTRRHGGLGLGLAIVKQLVTAHGGSVSAHSDGPGHGARFVVEMPARQSIPSPVPALSPSAQAVDLVPDAGAPRLDGLVLLVVDDEEDALHVTTRVLTAHGAKVHPVASAREAMDALATLRPDVIVSDIGMPGEDGYSLIRRIRAMPPEQGGRTPALALTAYARREDAQRAFAAGYQVHVSKPIEPARLATVVANLGGRSVDLA